MAACWRCRSVAPARGAQGLAAAHAGGVGGAASRGGRAAEGVRPGPARRLCGWWARSRRRCRPPTPPGRQASAPPRLASTPGAQPLGHITPGPAAWAGAGRPREDGAAAQGAWLACHEPGRCACLPARSSGAALWGLVGVAVSLPPLAGSSGSGVADLSGLGYTYRFGAQGTGMASRDGQAGAVAAAHGRDHSRAAGRSTGEQRSGAAAERPEAVLILLHRSMTGTGVLGGAG
jgi:hypothetical protein